MIDQKLREEIRKAVVEEFDVEPERVTIYTHDELVDYIENMLRDMGIPENIIYYIDIDRIINDMMKNGELFYYKNVYIKIDW